MSNLHGIKSQLKGEVGDAPDSCGFLVKGDAGDGINPFGSQLLPAIRDATSQTERWIGKA
jgi:hypothetical protein